MVPHTPESAERTKEYSRSSDMLHAIPPVSSGSSAHIINGPLSTTIPGEHVEVVPAMEHSDVEEEEHMNETGLMLVACKVDRLLLTLDLKIRGSN